MDSSRYPSSNRKTGAPSWLWRAQTGIDGHGGKLYVCGPCVGSRTIAQQDMVAGAPIVGAATFVAECVSATNVLVY